MAKLRTIKKMIKKNYELLEAVPSFAVAGALCVDNSGKMYAREKTTGEEVIIVCPWIK